MNQVLENSQTKHREAGRLVASLFEEATKEIHLQIKKRGRVTTWTARRQQYSTHGA